MSKLDINDILVKEKFIKELDTQKDNINKCMKNINETYIAKKIKSLLDNNVPINHYKENHYNIGVISITKNGDITIDYNLWISINDSWNKKSTLHINTIPQEELEKLYNYLEFYFDYLIEKKNLKEKEDVLSEILILQ